MVTFAEVILDVAEVIDHPILEDSNWWIAVLMGVAMIVNTLVFVAVISWRARGMKDELEEDLVRQLDKAMKKPVPINRDFGHLQIHGLLCEYICH